MRSVKIEDSQKNVHLCNSGCCTGRKNICNSLRITLYVYIIQFIIQQSLYLFPPLQLCPPFNSHASIFIVSFPFGPILLSTIRNLLTLENFSIRDLYTNVRVSLSTSVRPFYCSLSSRLRSHVLP